MNREFVPYEEALALKELGFNEPCITWYFDTNVGIKLYPESQPGSGLSLKGFKNSHKKIGITDCTAPLYQQAFRWFREKGFYGDLTSDLSDNLEDRVFVYYIYSGTGCYFVDRSKEYKTYEMAELACLKELIEIVKQNKDEID